MRVKPNDSHCGVLELQLVQAVIAYVGSDRERMVSILKAVWPGLDIYRGGTHWRVIPYYDDGNKHTSIYVEL